MTEPTADRTAASDPRTPGPTSIGSLLERQETRNRILSAGAKVFGEKGVDAATVEDILGEAGVSRGTFYKYFSNKYEVLKSLFEIVTDNIYETVTEAARRAEDPDASIRAALEAYLDLHRRGGDLVPVLQTEAVRSESPLAPLRRDLMDRLVAFIGERARSVTDRTIDPLVFRSLLLTVEGVLNYLHEGGSFGDEEARRARAVLIPQFERTLGIADERTPDLPSTHPTDSST